MRKNTLFQYKKPSRKNTNQNNDKKQLLLQNPQSQAKISLLQISEQRPRVSIIQPNTFQNPQYRSYSTEFFSFKRTQDDRDFTVKQRQISPQVRKSNEHKSETFHQSVALKSTFSNQMKKILNPNIHKVMSQSTSNDKTPKKGYGEYKSQSKQKFRRINYFPLTVYEQQQIQKVDNIFRSVPSKQVLAILKRTNLVKDIIQSQKIFKDKSEQFLTKRKKSIFNIRPLIAKQRFEEQNRNRQNQSSQIKQSSPTSLPVKQMHANNKNIVKLRLLNRIKHPSLASK